MESYERCACRHCCHAKTIESCRSGHDSKMQATLSPKAQTPESESPKFDMTSEEGERKNEIASFVDNFAQSKRMYAENLQHQPFGVGDSFSKKEYRGKECHVGSLSDERDAMWNPGSASPMREREDGLYGHELGCKEPKNRMDLAIGWDTPTDSKYEPRLSHIDGSEGDTSSSIFGTMHPSPMRRNRPNSSNHPHDHPEYIRPDSSKYF